MKRRQAYLLGTALLLAMGTTFAGDVRMYGEGEIPQATDVARILGGNRPKMRGISLDPAYQTGNKVQDSLDQAAAPKTTVVGLPVEFAFNSAEILPEAKPQLDAIAEGIKMTNGLTILVEGHTDASGPESYNRKLSRMRAEAVKRYLVEHHGIDPSQLVIQGKGEEEPLNAANPFAPENRRVQFRAAK